MPAFAYYGATHDIDRAAMGADHRVICWRPFNCVSELMPLFLPRNEAHVLTFAAFSACCVAQGRRLPDQQIRLVRLSAALRAEYGREVGVTALCPGFVRTPLLETSHRQPGQRRHDIPLWLCASPEKVAAAASVPSAGTKVSS